MNEVLHAAASALGVKASGREISGEELRRRSTVVAGLAESNPQVRTSLRSFLRRKGFELIATLRSREEIEAFLTGSIGDLLVVDVTMDDMGVLDILRRARMGAARNPFLVVVGTVFQGQSAAIKSAIDAGVDDLLMKPLAPATLMDRITSLVQRRRPFIVTSDYVGPDRRRDPSRGSTIPLFEAPNTLAMKERGEAITPALLQERIDEVNKAIREERVRRLAFQIAFLVRLVVTGRNAGTSSPEAERPRLSRALAISHEAVTLLPDTAFDVHTSAWQAMTRAIEGFMDESEEWTLARVSGNSLDLAIVLHPDKGRARINAEVMQAVENYSARRQRLAEEERRKASPSVSEPQVDRRDEA